jgi:hypothetical protein
MLNLNSNLNFKAKITSIILILMCLTNNVQSTACSATTGAAGCTDTHLCIQKVCVSCTSNAECLSNAGNGGYCNLINGECTACDTVSSKCAPIYCTVGSDCATSTNLCISGKCESCTSNSDCATQGGNKGYCNVQTGVCTPCTVPSQCDSGVCVLGTCTACSSGSQCASNLCIGGKCTFCTSNSLCLTDGSNGGYCNVGTGACTPCTAITKSLCTSNYCSSTGLCAWCTNNNECPLTNLCNGGVCSSCYLNSDCEGVLGATGNSFNCHNGKCVECYTNSQCPQSYCNTTTNVCVPNAACTVSTDCTDSNMPVCEQGQCTKCTSSSQCPVNNITGVNTICNVDGTCSSCVYDSDCDSGLFCSSGMCIGPTTFLPPSLNISNVQYVVMLEQFLSSTNLEQASKNIISFTVLNPGLVVNNLTYPFLTGILAITNLESFLALQYLQILISIIQLDPNAPSLDKDQNVQAIVSKIGEIKDQALQYQYMYYLLLSINNQDNTLLPYISSSYGIFAMSSPASSEAGVNIEQFTFSASPKGLYMITMVWFNKITDSFHTSTGKLDQASYQFDVKFDLTGLDNNTVVNIVYNSNTSITHPYNIELMYQNSTTELWSSKDCHITDISSDNVVTSNCLHSTTLAFFKVSTNNHFESQKVIVFWMSLAFVVVVSVFLLFNDDYSLKKTLGNVLVVICISTIVTTSLVCVLDTKWTDIAAIFYMPTIGIIIGYFVLFILADLIKVQPIVKNILIWTLLLSLPVIVAVLAKVSSVDPNKEMALIMGVNIFVVFLISYGIADKVKMSAVVFKIKSTKPKGDAPKILRIV